LTKNIDTFNPVKVNFHEFTSMVADIWRARTWRGRLGYLLAPPGWTEPQDAPSSRDRLRPQETMAR
jgi:hypothetical protein